jgi:hypothetical protein
MVDGFQVPFIPFVDVVGSAGGTLFWQSNPIWEKVGVTSAVTTTSIVVVVPHWPLAGAKVYVVVPGVAVLIVDGLQVPEIWLLEIVGNAGAGLFWHTAPTGVKTGAATDVMVTAIVVAVPHWPVSGVKV